MEGLVDALYGKFILRDLFGKIVPGWLVLYALGITFGWLPLQLDASFTSDAVVVVIGAALGWIAAFAIQQIGEWTGYLHYWPSEYRDRTVRYARRVMFLRIATPDEKQQLERLLVIKEATGLTSLALAIAAMACVYSAVAGGLGERPESFSQGLALAFGLAVAAFTLRVSHLTHCDRQFAFQDAVLGPSSESDRMVPSR